MPCKTPSNVELLIALDVPHAFTPIEVRTGSHREPFATCTPLGWTVNGSIRNDGDDLSDSSRTTEVEFHLKAGERLEENIEAI